MFGTSFVCSPKGEAYIRCFVRLSFLYLVRRIILKLLLAFKSKFIDRWQWGEGQNPITIILPCILLSYLRLTVFHNGCLSVRAISLNELKRLKWNFVYRYELMRGSTEDNNHNPILHFIWAISLNYFHKRWFSLSYLGVQVVFDYNFCLL